MRNILIFLIIVSILSVSVSADFNFYSTNSEMMTCEYNPSNIDVLGVQNIGTSASNYQIKLSGDNKWSKVYPNKFFLPSGSTQLINLFSEAPTGAYDFDIIVYPDFGLPKVLKKKIIVDKCINVQLIAKKAGVGACAGKYIEIPLEITNRGVFEEEYFLSVDAFGEENFSKNNFKLKPSESLSVVYSNNLPKDFFGNKTITIKVKALKSGLISKLEIPIKINNCYNFDIKANNNVQVCNNDKQNITFTVNNLASLNTKVDLELNSPYWVKLNSKNVNLEGNSNKFVNVEINSDKAQETNITLSGKAFGKEVNKVVKIKSIECYDLDIKSEIRKDVCACNKEKYDLIIQNKGNKDDLVLDVFSEKINFHKQKSILLNTKNKVTYDFDLDIPCSSIGTGEIQSIATSNGEIRKKNSTILNIYSPYKCKQAEFKVNKFKFTNDESKRFTLDVINTGIKRASYKINAYPVDLVTFNIRNVVLEPGKSFSVPFSLTKDDTGIYSVLFSAVSKDQNYEQEFLFVVGDVHKSKVAMYTYGFIGLIILLLILNFVRKKIQKSKRNFKKIFTISFLIVLLGYLLYLFYQKFGLKFFNYLRNVDYGELFSKLSKNSELLLHDLGNSLSIGVNYVILFLKLYGLYLIVGLIILFTLIFIFEKRNKFKSLLVSKKRDVKVEEVTKKKSNFFDFVLNFFFEIEKVEVKTEEPVKVKPKKIKTEVPKEVKSKKVTKKVAKKKTDIPEPWSKVKKYKKVNKD